VKPSTFFNWLLVVLIVAVVVVTPYIASPAVKEPLAKSDAAARAGDYKAAAVHLKQVLTIHAAPGVLHNLGNAEFHQKHLGAAILAWERAHALSPGYRNTIANLRFARSHAGLPEPEPNWLEKYAALLSPDIWLWTATAAFWGTVGCLAWPYLFQRRRQSAIQAGAMVLIGIFLLTLPALAGIVSRGRVGVILAPETLLRLTPTTEGEVLGKLAEGELARVEKTRGKFVYVRGASDRAGWVKHEEFARIWQ
jgi:hypothetical protein